MHVVYVHAHVRVCTRGGQRPVSGVTPRRLTMDYVLKYGLTGLELTNQARLAGHRAPGMHTALTP